MRAVLLLLFPFLVRADPGDDCFRFYYGPGKDLVRARVCFEALMPSQPCAGSSPELPRLYLGAMYVDGQGGPVNRPAAEALFTGCFRDSSVEALLKKKPAGNLDFCHDVGGTTLAELQCNALTGTLRSAELEEVKRTVRAGLDGEGAALFDRANEAWSAFVTADGRQAFDQYRGGTLAPVFQGETQNAHTEARVKRLKSLPGYRPDPVSGADAALNAAYKKLMDSSDEQYRKLLREAEREWIAYRDAESAFYEHRFADRFGGDAVAEDVKSRLSADRAKELAKPDH